MQALKCERTDHTAEDMADCAHLQRLAVSLAKVTTAHNNRLLQLVHCVPLGMSDMVGHKAGTLALPLLPGWSHRQRGFAHTPTQLRLLVA